VGGYNTEGSAQAVAVAGDYAYVADGAAGLQVIDIRDPANPRRVGGYGTSGYASGVAVAGNYAYLGDGGYVWVLDIRNPADPQRVAYYRTMGCVFGVALAGNFAYVADGYEGLAVLDLVPSPTAPRLALARYGADLALKYWLPSASGSVTVYVSDTLEQLKTGATVLQTGPAPAGGSGMLVLPNWAGSLQRFFRLQHQP
jgi:hypothetical protein